jgi:N-dimethylarginine dimethylaminohydrolase
MANSRLRSGWSGVRTSESGAAQLAFWLAGHGITSIEASYPEVMAMSCNLLALGDDRVISPRHSLRINQALRAEGILVLDPELDHFARGGGSVHCLTMPLARDKVPS